MQTLDGWRGSFVGKKEKESEGDRAFMSFLDYMESKKQNLLLKTQCCLYRS